VAPDGFDITLYADDDLAHDVFSMTVDSFGRVVVSGLGYTRILLDQDQDGRADSFINYADGPKTGAQGLFFYGRDLLCTGDGGLIRYVDRNGDDRADGPPQLFLKANAGGEHHIHAVRQGPDGWWYVMAGNFSGITDQYVTLAGSPVRRPEAGTLLRLSPDLTQGEVVAHGYRNAYDFDFHAQGDIFTYDSDGERDVSLPWYRPTRVFQAIPGSHAGWFGENWKRPDDFFDMPPVIASFGRGSPTGVVCYRHVQFPPEYRNALFVLDWTYGRVLAVPLAPAGSVWRSTPHAFVSSAGEFGFAPTDAEVGPDGSLFISVGGRGTRGGVYRVRWTGPASPADAVGTDDLSRCLAARQPLSSWSRRVWEPLAARLGAEAFVQAVLDSNRPLPQRVRAIEILTEKFGGPAAEVVEQLSRSTSPELRARAAWSVAVPRAPVSGGQLRPFLADRHPLVLRTALESLLRCPEDEVTAYADLLVRHVASPDPFVRQAATRNLVRAPEATFHQIAAAAVPLGWQSAIPVASAYVQRRGGFVPYGLEIAVRILGSVLPVELHREAARLAQLSLGDLAPADGVDAVFAGYAATVPLADHKTQTNTLIEVIERKFPTGNSRLDQELGRLIAMIQPDSSLLLDRVLARLTPESDPVEDVHYLIVAARLACGRTDAQRQKIASVLLALDRKFETRGLQRDSNWDDRTIEMYIQLVDRDPQLPQVVLAHPELGAPGHVPFVFAVEEDQIEAAADRFLARLAADPEYRWTGDLVFLLSQSERPEVRELLRSKVEDFSIQAAVLAALAESPQPGDRSLLVTGLDSHDLSLISDVLGALDTLGADPEGSEQVALVRTLRRLGDSAEERQLTTRILAQLSKNTGQELSVTVTVPGPAQDRELTAVWSDWAAATHPDEWQRQSGTSAEQLTAVQQQLQSVDWEAGDVARGERLYLARSCGQCHGSRRALGPDLAGVAGRFSRDDLFTAITLPSKDVSPRYQATLVATTAGKLHTGLVVYEAVDGLVLRDIANRTVRIATKDISVRRQLTQSIMPEGLLRDLQPSDFADLYAYLRSLGSPSAQTAGAAAPGR
jgi:putative membrane-bound dehydrogenase-like protein